MRLRIDTPIRAELHWKSYAATEKLGDWVEEAEAVAAPATQPVGWAFERNGLFAWA